MRHERLDQELTEDARNGLDLNILGGTSLNPLLGLLPGLIQRQETTLASSLDQLVWFGDKLGAGGQQPRVGDLGLVQDILDSGILGEIERGQSSRGVMSRGGRERRRLDDGSASEVIVENGLAVGLEDRFGGHCV